jgi:dihydrodipicolinate synthase/N-acetylneuraminate lyase
MLRGAIPALVTPFTANGKLNESKVRDLNKCCIRMEELSREDEI